MRLSEIEARVAGHDAALKAITGQSVAHLTQEQMIEHFRASRPTAEAGIEDDAVGLLRTILDRYEHGSDEDRETIRELFHRYGSFRGSVNLPWEPTLESFRLHALHMSARDLAGDARDEILGMGLYRQRAAEAGIDVDPIVREVGAISSDVDHSGMGPARRLFLGPGE